MKTAESSLLALALVCSLAAGTGVSAAAAGGVAAVPP
jgi:hypothetical protein